MSHYPVVRADKETTKIRPVFNASARHGGPSLNDCLYAGPNLLSRIYDILLRFRCYLIPILSDIKQAFLRVKIHHDHVDFLRFLWLNPENINETVIYRFLTAVFGVTSSTFLLEGTIQHHCSRMVEQRVTNLEFVEKFLQNLYVDDSMGGVQSVAEGVDWY